MQTRATRPTRRLRRIVPPPATENLLAGDALLGIETHLDGHTPTLATGLIKSHQSPSTINHNTLFFSVESLDPAPFRFSPHGRPLPLSSEHRVDCLRRCHGRLL